jgi:phosphate-selective porin
MASGLVVPLLLSCSLACPLVAQSSAESTTKPAESPVKLSGYLQAREVYQDDIGLTGSINRARLAASGVVADVVSWRVQGEFRTGSVGTGRASVSLQDAYIRYNPGAWALQAGQFKTPFSREFITSLADIETADRSTVVDSLAPKRDIGLMGEYRKDRISVLAGIFNGEGQNVSSNADSTLLGVGRVAVQLLARLSVAVNAARYFGDSTRYGVDAAYEGTRVALKGEYLRQRRDGTSTPYDSGWYGLGTLTVSPALQVVGKYEEFKRPGISSASSNSAWTAGVNIYPATRNLRLIFDFVSRKSGDPGTRKDRILGQVQVKF